MPRRYRKRNRPSRTDSTAASTRSGLGSESKSTTIRKAKHMIESHTHWISKIRTAAESCGNRNILASIKDYEETWDTVHRTLHKDVQTPAARREILSELWASYDRKTQSSLHLCRSFALEANRSLPNRPLPKDWALMPPETDKEADHYSIQFAQGARNDIAQGLLIPAEAKGLIRFADKTLAHNFRPGAEQSLGDSRNTESC